MGLFLLFKVQEEGGDVTVIQLPVADVRIHRSVEKCSAKASPMLDDTFIIGVFSFTCISILSS